MRNLARTASRSVQSIVTFSRIAGVRCATFFDAASTFLNNEPIVVEESAARPRLLPASERKSRRALLCDSGHKYQSTLFNREWLATKSLDPGLPLESVFG